MNCLYMHCRTDQGLSFRNLTYEHLPKEVRSLPYAMENMYTGNGHHYTGRVRFIKNTIMDQEMVCKTSVNLHQFSWLKGNVIWHQEIQAVFEPAEIEPVALAQVIIKKFLALKYKVFWSAL